MWRKQDTVSFRTAFALVCCSILAACESAVIRSLPTIASSVDAGGVVATDEPQAALVARDILNAGGSAADAAVALGFTLSVTLQSSAGLGGGGLCTVYDSATGRTEVLDFLPIAATGRQMSARWQTSVPTLARGMFALHAKHGRLPWQQVVVPAENLARFGHSISRAFARDILLGSDSLVNDPEALDTFMSPRRTLLREGERLVQLDLAATLGRIRGRTPGDFYVGALARTIDESALTSGVSISAEDLRDYSPVWKNADTVTLASSRLFIGAHGLSSSELPTIFAVDASSEQEITTTAPSSTSFIVGDAEGNAVACALTMVKPFGAGLLMDGLGFLIAPAPNGDEGSRSQLIAVAKVGPSSDQLTFFGAAGGEGAAHVLAHIIRRSHADNASLADSYPSNVSTDSSTMTRERRALVNAAHCPNGFENALRSCDVSNDPLGLGYGLMAYGER